MYDPYHLVNLSMKYKIKKLPSKKFFLSKLIENGIIGLLLITGAELLGMWGYHYFEAMSWIDAFVNAAMILSGMGPLSQLASTGGKLFAGFYALFSGLLFIVILGIIFGPFVHRFLHQWHLDIEEDL